MLLRTGMSFRRFAFLVPRTLNQPADHCDNPIDDSSQDQATHSTDQSLCQPGKRGYPGKGMLNTLQPVM
jgi:hypothetical protein